MLTGPMAGAAAAFALLAVAGAAQPLGGAVLPDDPAIAFVGHERYRARGRAFVRYRIQVTNRAGYPAAMFARAPHLAPCGRNRNAARTWVDIYRENGERLYGFCALRRPEDLRALWFALPAGTEPPKRIYIELNDRESDIIYRSAPLEIPAPATSQRRAAPVAP